MTELENYENEDSKSMLRYSASMVESLRGHSPTKNEHHSFLLRQHSTGKISLKFKMDVRSKQFLDRQLSMRT